MRTTARPISWLNAAKRDFEEFPRAARDAMLDALTVVASGGMPGMAKPLRGFGAGVLELALRFRGEAYRVVYALRIGEAIWVVHAFQKKAKTGIKTPKSEIDVISERLKRLKEMAR
jgi:phage-related protein